MLKHEGYTAAVAHVAAALCEGVSDIGCCTVSVICQHFYNNSYAVGAIAFVGYVFVFYVFTAAGRLFDTSVDGIVWHVVGFAFCDNITQLAVYGGVGTAGLYRNLNFSAQHGKDFTFFCIVFFFFMFDICKLRMS